MTEGTTFLLIQFKTAANRAVFSHNSIGVTAGSVEFLGIPEDMRKHIRVVVFIRLLTESAFVNGISLRIASGVDCFGCFVYMDYGIPVFLRIAGCTFLC